jgi:hypothetical protein
VPASPGTAAGERPALGRRDGRLAVVEELEDEDDDEDLLVDGADGDDELRCESQGRRRGSR